MQNSLLIGRKNSMNLRSKIKKCFKGIKSFNRNSNQHMRKLRDYKVVKMEAK